MRDNKRFKISAILFDLDGTLIDTIGDLTLVCNQVLGELGRPLLDKATVQSYLGDGVRELMKRCLGGMPDEGEFTRAMTIFNQCYGDANGQDAAVYPGVFEALEHACSMGLRLACVTNKATQFTLPLLEQKKLAPFFAVTVCGDTLATRKPEPEMLWYACDLLSTPPGGALMVGDSRNDVQAAKAAGMPVLLLRDGYHGAVAVDSMDAAGLISDLTGVFDYIEPAVD